MNGFATVPEICVACRIVFTCLICVFVWLAFSSLNLCGSPSRVFYLIRVNYSARRVHVEFAEIRLNRAVQCSRLLNLHIYAARLTGVARIPCVAPYLVHRVRVVFA